MSEREFMKVEIVAAVEGIGGYEASLLHGAIALAYDLAQGNEVERLHVQFGWMF